MLFRLFSATFAMSFSEDIISWRYGIQQPRATADRRRTSHQATSLHYITAGWYE